MNGLTRRTIGVALSIFVCVFTAQIVEGKIGVGMGAGEIKVTQDIKPGGIYELPTLRIFNTGDETTTYGMNVAYHQDRHEFRPEKSWFSFYPATFTLGAGESQEVAISMTVPVKTTPGEYFAFLESGPVQSPHEGTSVGVAVATKLYFTVVPANIFQGFLYRVSAFMNTYAPWTWIGLGVIGVAGTIFVLTRFFSFNVSLRTKRRDVEHE